MSKKSLFLIDATAFCYRAYYATSGPRILRTSWGQETNAVYIFLNILNKILKEQKPDHLVCCFDVSRDTFRLARFAQYKMQRPAMPDGLASQIPIIKEVVAAYGIPIFEKKGFEADDIIAQLARKAAAKKISVTIVSSDKDILQLVAKHISVFSPYKDTGVLYDPAKVKERFGVAPERVSDIIALMGDAADNLPGVPGIGDITAKKLISKLPKELKVEIRNLWLEYSRGITKEGRFVKQADKMANLLQGMEYWKKYGKIQHRLWMRWIKEIIDDPVLIKFIKTIERKFY